MVDSSEKLKKLTEPPGIAQMLERTDNDAIDAHRAGTEATKSEWTGMSSRV